jgi:iduronate 2-sulfatase
MGDHGWHLGENGIWGKYTNFEQATHTPLMLKIPGRTEHGIISDSIVEFIDIFQTIVEAAGLDSVPQCPVNSGHVDVCTEGTSLLPLIDNPKGKVKDVAISQIFSHDGPRMGYSLRSDKYRYTEWIPMMKEKKEKQTNFHLLFDDVTEFELYDTDADPEENVNIAGNPQYGPITRRYSKLIKDLIQPSLFDVKANLF